MPPLVVVTESLTQRKTFNTFRVNQFANLQIENTTRKLQTDAISTEIKAITLKNDYFEFVLEATPFKTFDFTTLINMENMSLFPKKNFTAINFASNDNNAFSIIFQPSFTKYNEDGRGNYGLYLGSKYRFTDRLSIAFAMDYINQSNYRGWVDSNET